MALYPLGLAPQTLSSLVGPGKQQRAGNASMLVKFGELFGSFVEECGATNSTVIPEVMRVLKKRLTEVLFNESSTQDNEIRKGNHNSARTVRAKKTC